MKVLGIDPGIERLGWGLVEKKENGVSYLKSGVKKTLKTESPPARLLEIQNFLEELLARERPEVAAVERLFFSKNVKTALQVSEVRGVILAAAEKAGVAIKEFKPPEVKMALTGYGRAGKKNVAEFLKFSLKLPERKMLDDETDALALALCGIYSRKQ